jgi:hypothetical protein
VRGNNSNGVPLLPANRTAAAAGRTNGSAEYEPFEYVYYEYYYDYEYDEDDVEGSGLAASAPGKFIILVFSVLLKCEYSIFLQ